MTDSRLLRTLALSTSLLIPACAVESDSPGDLVPTGDSTVVHVLAFHTGDATTDVAPAVAPHLTDFGGPKLTSIHVAPLFWNSTVRFQTNANWLYVDVTASPFYDQFAEYGIGRGNGQAGFVDNRATANLTDAQVQAEVLNQINLAHLPPPTNPNNYYPVHFPPNARITAPDGSQSCVQFCAYHGTFRVQNSAGTLFTIAYGVLPDVGNAGCAGGCGANATVANNETSVASHELIEATTDPDVGLATVIGPPLGWYDPNNGEIGDICNGQQKSIVVPATGRTYVVQKEWSNAANACL
jgi:hypothetical protein